MKIVDKVKGFDTSKPIQRTVQVMTRAVQPTEEQIELIRPYLLRDFPIEDLYIREVRLANDQHDRSGERFDKGYLQRFAETALGRSVLVGHNYGTAPVGRFFQAKVEKSDGWLWLVQSFYMPVSDGNQLARDNIDSGVWSFVSIGAAVDYAGFICDICGVPYLPWYRGEDESVCPHICGQTHDGKAATATWTSTRSDMSKVEEVEGSIVYLGCQYEAAISKVAGQHKTMEEAKMESLASLKGAVPSHTPPPADRERAWDGAAAERRLRAWAGGPDAADIDWAKYRKGFSWYDEENEETFGAYKLPHHDIVDGELQTIWRGVAAAAAALQGGRGGVDIPEGDAAGVRAHLARHYNQFDETPPWENEQDSASEATAGGRQKGEPNMKILKLISAWGGLPPGTVVNMPDEAADELVKLGAASESEQEGGTWCTLEAFTEVIKARDEAASKAAELEPQAKLADRLLGDLKTEVKRLAACCGDGETISSMIDGVSDVDKLVELRGSYEKRWNEKRPPHPQAEPEADGSQVEDRQVDPRVHSVLPG